MDEKYKMVLNEANELKINISSCQEDDTECLQTLIKEYTEAFNNVVRCIFNKALWKLIKKEPINRYISFS